MSFDDQPLASLHAWMQARNAAGSQPEAVQEEEKSEPKKPMNLAVLVVAPRGRLQNRHNKI